MEYEMRRGNQEDERSKACFFSNIDLKLSSDLASPVWLRLMIYPYATQNTIVNEENI